MVRHSLLAILDLGPCYGYQLRVEFERRTGGSWPLNVGQVYATLDRLERDGLVAKATTDAAGYVYYEITPAGSAEAATWLRSPTPANIAVKLALASTLPGPHPAQLIDAQRRLTADALERYRAEKAQSLARSLVLDALMGAAEAELAWLDSSASRLAGAEPYGLEVVPPKRGRPAVVR